MRAGPGVVLRFVSSRMSSTRLSDVTPSPGRAEATDEELLDLRAEQKVMKQRRQFAAFEAVQIAWTEIRISILLWRNYSFDQIDFINFYPPLRSSIQKTFSGETFRESGGVVRDNLSSSFEPLCATTGVRKEKKVALPTPLKLPIPELKQFAAASRHGRGQREAKASFREITN
jgi:hypothetical protein